MSVIRILIDRVVRGTRAVVVGRAGGGGGPTQKTLSDQIAT